MTFEINMVGHQNGPITNPAGCEISSPDAFPTERQTAWFDTHDYSNETGQLADDMEEMLGAGHMVILSEELGPTILKGDPSLDPPWRGEVGEALSTAREALDRLFPASPPLRRAS